MKSINTSLLLGLTLLIPNVSFADTLDNVAKKDVLTCGVSTGLAGFALTDSTGIWKGLDVSVCQSVAAAVLGDASKVKYIPLTTTERFTALQSGEIDILSRNTTWTETRDTSLGFNFAGVNYYDGQGFLVSNKLNVTSAKELDGATFCLQAGSTTEMNLTDYFKTNNMEYRAVTYDTPAQTVAGFKTGRCDAITSDASQLYSLKLQMDEPASYVVLPEIISKEPLGPVVRQGDDKWLNIVKWTLYAALEAEELGVTKDNVAAQLKSANPGVQRLLGVSGKMGENLGLDPKWAYNVVAQVGNYGEVFEKNVGKGSPLQIDRGLNKLWKDGGLMYSMPVR
ncbi:amino acid ABC transporter substrate-binding protein [Psychromonas sp. PT13]|uniref:amino acid ABC transporter substrate-binding protein n=1 Tax=Psychromonas sp. PT13 TaxID=3439547 RepID=UPI003EBE3A09